MLEVIMNLAQMGGAFVRLLCAVPLLGAMFLLSTVGPIIVKVARSR